MYRMNRYIVEFVGTAFFLYVILATGNAFATGAALAIAILIGGPISGGSFNPAVTIMLAAANKLPGKDVIPYIVAEIAGGLAALELFRRM
jgi:glycerol uptake facilitator-like aquaporin